KTARPLSVALATSPRPRSSRQTVSSPEILTVEPLEQARLVRVSLPDVADPLRGLFGPAGPIGQIAEVPQQPDRSVVVALALRGDQLFDFAPRGRLAASQLIQMPGARLRLLPLAAGAFPGRLLGRLAGLVLRQSVAGREQFCDGPSPGGAGRTLT